MCRRAVWGVLLGALWAGGCGPTELEGHVTEFGSGSPVADAAVSLSRHDCEWEWVGVIPVQHCVWAPAGKTTTDEQGFYALAGFSGDDVLKLTVTRSGYLTYSTTELGAAEHETTTHDVALFPEPPSPIDKLTLRNVAEGLSVAWTNPPESNLGGVLLVRWQGESPGEATLVHGQAYRPGDQPGNGQVVHAGPGVSFLDRQVEEGKDYWYRAFAYSKVHVYAAGSDAAKLHRDAAAPGPVTGLTATPQKTSILLSWQGPSEPHEVLVVRSPDAPLDTLPTGGEELRWNDSLGNGVVIDVVSSSGGTKGSSCSDAFPPGRMVHYTLFTFDEVFNYSGGASTSALNPMATWQLKIVGATISQGQVWDPELAAAEQAPDPFVGLKMDCANPQPSDCSAPQSNSYSPVWNLVTGPHKGNALHGPFCIVVGDRDGGPECYMGTNELIASCQVSLSDADLLKGSAVVDACPGISNLELELTAAD